MTFGNSVAGKPLRTIGRKSEHTMGDCINCTWYETYAGVGHCHNPDCYTGEEWENGELDRVRPDDGCTLWEEE